MFEKGDIVQLKSGGPKMTVCDVPQGGIINYSCKWFEDIHPDTQEVCANLCDGHFPIEALEKAEEKRKAKIE